MAENKKKWNSERLLSLTAMSMSFFTLVIFIYQTNLMSKQNYLSILPYLAISTSHNASEQTFELSLDNYGVGPAIIESVKMVFKDKRYDLVDYNNDLFTFLAEMAPAMDSIKNYSFSSLDKGTAIPVNYKYNILKVKSPKDYQIITSSLDSLLKEGLYYEIIYRSIQDERWLIHNNSDGPIKLE